MVLGGSKEKGYIILTRNKKGMEKICFNWILHNILIPFVQKLRMDYNGFDVTGGQIPEEYCAVFWCDGDNLQTDIIVSKEGIRLFREHGIIGNNHNASRTGSEQTPDLNRVFPVGKKLNKNMSVKHIPAGDHTLKRQLTMGFDQLCDKNSIRIKKPHVLVDYFAKQAQVLSRSHVPENVVHGVLKNGMVDLTIWCVPVFQNIIGTIRRVPTLKEVELCKQAFHSLMSYSYQNGMHYIPDSVYIKLGFPVDIDVFGNDKIRVRAV